VTYFDPAEMLDLSLSCVEREFPYYLEHAVDAPMTVRRPRDLHPSFYGCSDWHSAVHNHWLLLHLSRAAAGTPEAGRARRVLDRHLTPERLAGELSYLRDPLNAAFSRPYGWAWLLRLHAEARTEPAYAEALQPLRDELAGRLAAHFGGGLRFPIRSGVHGNTAFSLLGALDAARLVADHELAGTLAAAARRMFEADRDHPSAYEPSGGDFLSPGLTEASLMSAVLEPDEYAPWLTAFLPGLADDPLLALPVYAPDAADPATVHLHGLVLSKVWTLCRIRAALPGGDPRAEPLATAARVHFDAAAGVLSDRHYHAVHWIPTYATLAQEAIHHA